MFTIKIGYSREGGLTHDDLTHITMETFIFASQSSKLFDQVLSVRCREELTLEYWQTLFTPWNKYWKTLFTPWNNTDISSKHQWLLSLVRLSALSTVKQQTVQVYLRDTILSNKTASTKHNCYTSSEKNLRLLNHSLHFPWISPQMNLWVCFWTHPMINGAKDHKKRCTHMYMYKSITVIFLSYMHTTEKLISARKRKPKSTPQINQCSRKCWEKTTHFCLKVYSVLQFMRVITFIWVLRHSYTAGGSLLLYWII